MSRKQFKALFAANSLIFVKHILLLANIKFAYVA